MEVKVVDEENKNFWNEICGGGLARHLGITEHNEESLKKFDNFYWDYYPYLASYIPFAEIADKKVLEVGLGYGTLSQKLMEENCHYHGLDIALHPVELVRHRLRLLGKTGEVLQDSILNCPFADNTFDYVIAIGCYHHTGNLQKALDETYRVLKKSGKAIIMVYNAYSYRHWITETKATLNRFLQEKILHVGRSYYQGLKDTIKYDQNVQGEAAPHTDFLSIKMLRSLTRKYSSFYARRENIGNDGPFLRVPREKALKYGGLLGLDIYFTLKK